MQIKVLVIEDEITARKHITKLLKQLDIDISVVSSLTSIASSVAWLKNNEHPDIILMDIHLSDGVSFDIMEEVTIKCPIIYTTAYDEYAIKAFKTTGIDYLLKPISKEDLKGAIAKYQASKTKEIDEWFLKSTTLLQKLQLKKSNKFKERFLLKTGTSMFPVKSDEIAYFYRDELVFAKLFNEKSYPLDDSLNSLQEVLDPNLFVRLNRQLLVNINAIKKLSPFKPGQLHIEIEPAYHETIYLSQERSSWLKHFLDKD
ncbi:response regulator [Flavobacteriaceae bacterium R38]|nr:response regulator [Flavobacteriaceae bacterium R38]